jgi:hypothetical protein
LTVLPSDGGRNKSRPPRNVAFQEQRDGRAVDWMEKVSDEPYRAGSSAE